MLLTELLRVLGRRAAEEITRQRRPADELAARAPTASLFTLPRHIARWCMWSAKNASRGAVHAHQQLIAGFRHGRQHSASKDDALLTERLKHANLAPVADGP